MDIRSSLNQLLFSKSIPNHVIPYPTQGRKIYPCTECGDKFIFESSYEDHINRKVIHIIFKCKRCNKELVFKNRCKFLQHIRTHFTKTFTINYNDLVVQLLPVEDLPIHISRIKFNDQPSNTIPSSSSQEQAQKKLKPLPNSEIMPKTVTQIKTPTQPEVLSNPKIPNVPRILTEPITSFPVKTPTSCAQAETKKSWKKSISQLCEKADKQLNSNDNSVITPQFEELELTKTYNPVVRNQAIAQIMQHFKCEICSEVTINTTHPIWKLRAEHYRRSSDKLFKCPVCLCVLPNECAMETHLKLHLFVKPHICPECGKDLRNRSSALKYPFSHDCDGFRMMRLSARVQCPEMNCRPFHPNDIISHMKKNHLKMFFKCVECNAASPDKNIIYRHLTQNHEKKTNATILFQCLMCQELLPNESIRAHVQLHATNVFVFPCWNCHNVFHKVIDLIKHSRYCNNEGSSKNEEISNLSVKCNVKSYKVHKRCDKCNRVFIYKCRYNEIDKLPNECPYCNPLIKANKIVCPLCKESVCFERNDMEKHFALKHKEINIACRVLLKSSDNISITHKMKRSRKRSSKNDGSKRKKMDIVKDTVIKKLMKCNHCEYSCANKAELVKHLTSQHRDPGAAYQCLECGQCFVVELSFVTHLAVKHNIYVEEYFNNQTFFISKK